MKPTEIQARAAKAGITLKDLLVAAGVNRATWWRWSTGRFQPRAATVERIEAALQPHRK